MLFEIVHRTDYRYGHAAREACVEARLTPPALPTQEILSHSLQFNPSMNCSHYEDSFGNNVTFYAMALRHARLSVVNTLSVRTHEPRLDHGALDVSCAEARQIFASELTNIFDYLQPTSAVPTGGEAKIWARQFFAGSHPLRQGLDGLNSAIHAKFSYKPGTTENSTPLEMVWKQKEGVCQDFAHVMLSVLRTAGIPARYICGYIESGPPEGGGLLGSMATHAWVEALLPGMTWVALDPTNNQWCGVRHVTVSYGRDFRDAAPVRGIFKGSGPQGLKVKVTMRRMPEKR